MQIIGIDVGTLSTKGLIISDTGLVIGRHSIRHPVSSPHQGWAEQDGESIWWAESVKVIHHLLKQPGARPDEIVGIGVSGYFPALLLADVEGKVLRPAILYADNRARQELSELNSELGLDLDGDAITPKLVWLHRHEPDVFKNATYFFTSHNYVVFRLTGSYKLDYKVADSLGGLLDPTKLNWREDVANWIGISPKQLPSLCSPHEIAGIVSLSAAQETGLPVGTPVIIGSGDSLLTLVGSGVVNRGQALLSIGTTGWLAVCPFDLEHYFKEPGLATQGAPYLLSEYLLTCGSALQWFLETFSPDEIRKAKKMGTSPYFLLDEKVMRVPPGANGVTFLPYFQGSRSHDRVDPTSGAILGLNLSHSSAHIYRALLESFGYAIHSGLEGLSAEGIEVLRLVISGGGAVSLVWRQILSDIFAKPLYYYREADPCLGNAALLAHSLGIWSTLNEIQGWLSDPMISEPDLEKHEMYRSGYERFIDARRALSN